MREYFLLGFVVFEDGISKEVEIVTEQIRQKYHFPCGFENVEGLERDVDRERRVLQLVEDAERMAGLSEAQVALVVGIEKSKQFQDGDLLDRAYTNI